MIISEHIWTCKVLYKIVKTTHVFFTFINFDSIIFIFCTTLFMLKKENDFIWNRSKRVTYDGNYFKTFQDLLESKQEKENWENKF